MSMGPSAAKTPVPRLLVLTTLLAAVVIAGHAQSTPVTIQIDVNANRHAISPNIYGLAYPDAASLADLNIPVQRYGGNNTSRYNWQVNGDNRGSDWYFESIGDDSATAGARIDDFFSTGQAAGAQSLVTIPTIGWVAKLGAGRNKLSSFSQAKYGAQTGNDWQWFPDAGNGVLTNGQDVTGNDPNDADVPADSTFQQGLVQHEVNTFGTAARGGLRYYLLDNEPSIWFATHRDVHPVGPTMDEIKSKVIGYSAMIKGVDPSALVVAPEEWGWSGYFYSGYDQQYGAQHGWGVTLPDRANHGGWDYLPWLLDQLRQNDASTGKRSLDVFSVHYYPQGGEFGDDTSQATDLLRNHSTRSLWDPNYVDQSWINDKVMLIPRLKNWVSTYYPGTLTAVTEYNWGAEADINGATTQADILGIFGREGLDLATRWTTPDSTTPTYKSIKMYRNYDGHKSTFGDASVSDVAPNPDNLSSFAAIRSSDGALTIMLISKVLSGSTPVTVNLANFTGSGAAQVWQLTSANTISRLSDMTYSGATLSLTLPQQSITLLVLPAGTAHQPPVAAAKASPSSGLAPLVVSFDGTGSSDPAGGITTYAWSFGDGTTGSGPTVSHTYTKGGSYTATLTVTDTFGLQASASATCTVTTTPSYAGFVDHASCTTISGWAADRNRLNTSINVEIYDGATLIATAMASNSRPDVGAYLGDNGLHGFSLPTPASLKNGATHAVHVKFESSATELTNSPANLVCGTAAPPNYIGFVDHAACDSISGWAADRSRLGTSINVEVYDGTALIAIMLANVSRPDVGAYLGDNGLHGFTLPTPASLKTRTAHSIHLKFGTSATELSGSPASVNCATQTTNYVGYLDHAGCDFLSGWAADRNRLNTVITVSIYDGTTLIATVPANLSRPDVGKSLGDNGLHGFSVPTPAALVTHSAHLVHVKFETGPTADLHNSPASLTCP